ncbi:MAG: Omp28-related outer membrane protein, partial [Bacteroidales bacterium]|nr:Omp28-related outer membrane protein [Bacteroidales bacterium]
MKRIFLVLVTLFCATFVVPAQIADTIVSLAPTNRNVLLEEYTGIACGYCPDGHRRANEIAAANPGRVNIINIHTGTFSYNYYTTQFGSALAEQSGLTGYPAGTINRHVFMGSVTDLNRGYWAWAANQIMGQSSPVNIAAEATLDPNTRALHVRVQLYYTGSQTVTSNALNVAILQDNVLGPQSGGTANPAQVVGNQYKHMHMLRHLITGQWGETINTISQGTLVEKTYDYVIPAQLGSTNPIDAVLEDLRLVAFVCEGHQEVLTSVEVPIQYQNLPPIAGNLVSVHDLDYIDCSDHGNVYFKFKNMGSNDVTSLTYNYKVNNGALRTAVWNGNVPSLHVDTIHVPAFNTNLNTTNTVAVQVTAINGVNVNIPTESVTIQKNVYSSSGAMTLRIVTDMYASETTFKIFDSNGNEVLSGGPWNNLSAAGTTTHVFSFDPQADGCYRLEVYDSYGDGINSGYGQGYFQMTQNEGNVLLFQDNGQFGKQAAYLIDVNTSGLPCTTVYSEFTLSACNSYTWNGQTYSQSGNYVQTLSTINNCDSIVTLHLTVNQPTYRDTTATACGSFTWHDSTYTTSGSYQSYLTNAAGCDSIVTLHLTVNQPTTGDTTAIACDSFTWNGITYTSSGSYQSHLTNTSGCDSIVTLHLTVNHGDYAEVTVDTCGTEFFWEVSGQSYDHSDTYYYYSTNANACQDTIVLVLTLYQAAVTELSAQICEGDTYSQNGFNVSTSGDHYLNLQTAHGCDSTVILHLTVDNETVTNIAASICEGEDHVANGFEIIAPEAGIHEYSDTIHRPGTCDSIVVLHLTVAQPTYGDTMAIACDSFTWHGNTYTSSGSYQSHLTNAAGCDSIVTLHLTIAQPTTGDTTAIACDSFTWHGNTYTSSGSYQSHLTNTAGCDSIVTLHLTITQPTYSDTMAIACGSFTWHGITYTSSGSYQSYLTNTAGCDSIVTLHLTVIQPTYSDTTVTACDSYTWNGITYTQSVNYTQTFTNASGCDSTITLHLTINHSVAEHIEATACDSFTWHGITYTSSGSYQSHLTNAAGCDSIVTLHLTINQPTYGDTTIIACDSFTWHDITYTSSGSYQSHLTNAAGCDSTFTLHLTLVEAPALQAISGETAVCINQFATYYYDASDPDYHYRWFKDNALWAENVSRVMLHEMGEGSVLLTMQVSDNQYGCLADTSLTVLVLNHVAPDTTEIRRKANSNILVCAPVTSEYGQVHYRWGYTDIHTGSETVMPGDRNYCLYNIGIDTLSYRYWVETYLSEPIGEGCDNRSYYGQGVMTSTSDYDANIVEAYMSNNCIVLNVNALYPSNITAT